MAPRAPAETGLSSCLRLAPIPQGQVSHCLSRSTSVEAGARTGRNKWKAAKSTCGCDHFEPFHTAKLVLLKAVSKLKKQLDLSPPLGISTVC